jgi:hypothetical protein
MISKVQSKASTVLPALVAWGSPCRDQRGARVILKNLDASYEESMQYGMIGYHVPLPFAALASQKNYMSLYMMSVYCGCVGDSLGDQYARWFREAWVRTGKPLHMGKACIRFTFCEASLPRASKSAGGKQIADRAREKRGTIRRRIDPR